MAKSSASKTASAKTDRETLDALVREAGGRATPARAEILALLLESRQPLSHREVEEALHARKQSFDRVTIYRALEWLEASGLAHKIAGEDRVWRFRGSAAADHEHAHFQCRSCGTLICLDAVPQPVALPHAPRGFKVERAELTLRGLCPSCK